MFVVITQCHWPAMAIVALQPTDGNRLFDTEKEATEWAEEEANFPYIVVDLDKYKTPGFD